MSYSRGLPVIGIVGGIGSGKSSVPRKLSERRALRILDADKIGHELLNDQTVKDEIRNKFGPDVFDSDGNISRPSLAGVVFGDSARNQQDRKTLNEILHPKIRKEIRRQIEHANQDASTEAVILDAALLLETGWDQECNTVVFVDVPRPVRQQRVVENRGWTPEELTKREKNQLPVNEKKSRCDHSIDNGGALNDAAEALETILDTLLSNRQPG